MLDNEGRALRAELLEVFRGPVGEPLADDAFNELASRIFAYQFARNAPYAAFCRRRSAMPDRLDHWRDIPAVPTAAFKEVPLVAGDPGTAEATFLTSGTTQGRRGTHIVLDLSIYHAALLPVFREFVLPDDIALPILSLVPSSVEAPDSSLAHMISVVIDRLGAPGSRHCASSEGGIHEVELHEALASAERSDQPVMLIGTSFAFVHWTDVLRAAGKRYRLPRGSRLMDTGGYKGRSRGVDEDELRALYAELLGLDTDSCVNEYGMTELCSQCYDSSLRARVLTGSAGRRRKLAPAWVRTVIVDPDTLAPLPHGETGLLRVIDLANLGSVIAVQTEDLAVNDGDGFRVLGRAAGAQPRGCSIATEELIEAARQTL